MKLRVGVITVAGLLSVWGAGCGGGNPAAAGNPKLTPMQKKAVKELVIQTEKLGEVAGIRQTGHAIIDLESESALDAKQALAAHDYSAARAFESLANSAHTEIERRIGLIKKLSKGRSRGTLGISFASH
jgi:hypothetical protein